MHILAIVSTKQGNSTDKLVDTAIAGATSKKPDATVTKINLPDRDIKFCLNCLACMKSTTDGPMAKCVIRDDMDEINQELLRADTLIFGTPVHMGFAPGNITTLLERICWIFAKPEKSYVVVKGCPMPRSDKKRSAVIIVTSGIVAPHLRKLCDQATPFIKGVIKDSLNCTTVGDMYAGDIWHRGVEHYTDKAFRLGTKLG